MVDKDKTNDDTLVGATLIRNIIDEMSFEESANMICYSIVSLSRE